MITGIQGCMFADGGDGELVAVEAAIVTVLEPDFDGDEIGRIETPSLAHRWAIAAIALVDEKTAKHAALRGSFRTADRQRIEALECYCASCRRPYDDVKGKPCEAAIDNTHLIGGDPGVRKKRLVYEPEGEIVAGPSVSRQGAESYVNGDGAPVG